MAEPFRNRPTIKNRLVRALGNVLYTLVIFGVVAMLVLGVLWLVLRLLGVQGS